MRKMLAVLTAIGLSGVVGIGDSFATTIEYVYEGWITSVDGAYEDFNDLFSTPFYGSLRFESSEQPDVGSHGNVQSTLTWANRFFGGERFNPGYLEIDFPTQFDFNAEHSESGASIELFLFGSNLLSEGFPLEPPNLARPNQSRFWITGLTSTFDES